jgi:hypothetical protein
VCVDEAFVDLATVQRQLLRPPPTLLPLLHLHRHRKTGLLLEELLHVPQQTAASLQRSHRLGLALETHLRDLRLPQVLPGCLEAVQRSEAEVVSATLSALVGSHQVHPPWRAGLACLLQADALGFFGGWRWRLGAGERLGLGLAAGERVDAEREADCCILVQGKCRGAEELGNPAHLRFGRLRATASLPAADDDPLVDFDFMAFDEGIDIFEEVQEGGVGVDCLIELPKPRGVHAPALK